jgi:UDPglucose--hexose-1-phosphate uridylyltransferase
VKSEKDLLFTYQKYQIMPELRKDPVVGRWVIIATERARRPGNFIQHQTNIFDDPKQCPFCKNQDAEIFAVRNPGAAHDQWKVKVAPNGTPIVSSDVKFKRRGVGVYDVVTGYGANEVVIETPEHIANMADLSVDQIESVLHAYVARFKELEKDANLQYVFAYKNYGEASGSRPIGHARSQIIAVPVNPLRVKEKLVGAKQYYEYHDRCLYCDLIRQELEDRSRLITETDHFIVVAPFAPRFPFELMILPKKHCCDFADGISGAEKDLAALLKDVLMRFKFGLDDCAYNYVIQTAPIKKKQKGAVKWETIQEDYHWHLEIVPRLARPAGFEKGSGFYICAIPPEETAEFLRRVKI